MTHYRLFVDPVRCVNILNEGVGLCTAVSLQYHNLWRRERVSSLMHNSSCGADKEGDADKWRINKLNIAAMERAAMQGESEEQIQSVIEAET